MNNRERYEDYLKRREEFEEWHRQRTLEKEGVDEQRRVKLQSDDLEEFLQGYDPAEVGGRGSEFSYEGDPVHLSGQEHFDKLLALARAEVAEQQYRAKLKNWMGLDKMVASLDRITAPVSLFESDQEDSATQYQVHPTEDQS